jgi:hypothetical protein
VLCRTALYFKQPVSKCAALSCLLQFAEANEFDGNRAGRHFAVPIGHGAGKPYPLGPTLVSTTRSSNPQDVRCTMNFAVGCLGDDNL